ncbi:hypothetical protein EVAR_47031_1 [Eumeta japonica]|uniref:Uncharacterized protein n=1 Tax=Eumeta variegata TaxID=151549 RepID=A0A4C1XJB5_EUMVA|nr:hypothetical protein EVAR_47031_1 [Eumeta japonica]
MVVKAGYGRRKMKVGSMQRRCDRYVVWLKYLGKTCRNRKVKERCVLKEDIVTRVERVAETRSRGRPVASTHYSEKCQFKLVTRFTASACGTELKTPRSRHVHRRRLNFHPHFVSGVSGGNFECRFLQGRLSPPSCAGEVRPMREDREKEILVVADKNKRIRNELVELNSQLMDTRKQTPALANGGWV